MSSTAGKRKRWKRLRPLLFLLLPIVTALLLVLERFVPAWAGSRIGSYLGDRLSLLSFLTCIYGIILGVRVMMDEVSRRRLELRAKSLTRRERNLIRETHLLGRHVDILAAQREISLILNEALDFRDVMGNVLKFLAGFLEAQESEIVLWSQNEAGDLAPRAGWRDNKVQFEDELAGQLPITGEIRNAFEHRQPFIGTEGRGYSFALPLVADRDIVGVMKVDVLLEGERDQRVARAQEIEDVMTELAKMIALSVKTPDLYTKAVQDGLTGLATKRHFLQQLEIHFGDSVRREESLALVMIDIDHFKSINDTYGHLTGDNVLKGVSGVLKTSMKRKSDSRYGGYRYGGEELSLILPNATAEKARALAEGIRKKIEKKKFKAENGKTVSVTASMGISELGPGMTQIEDLISAADEALYRAKDGGRNQVVVASDIADAAA